jgi:hypothetical protein
VEQYFKIGLSSSSHPLELVIRDDSVISHSTLHNAALIKCRGKRRRRT